MKKTTFNSTKTKKSKCFGCLTRKPGCHAHCIDYQQFRKELDQQNEINRLEAYYQDLTFLKTK